jgi:hypothetical protein
MWNLKDQVGSPVAPGLYYLLIEPDGQKRQLMSVVVLK